MYTMLGYFLLDVASNNTKRCESWPMAVFFVADQVLFIGT